MYLRIDSSHDHVADND
jgi:hypothetical protein